MSRRLSTVCLIVCVCGFDQPCYGLQSPAPAPASPARRKVTPKNRDAHGDHVTTDPCMPHALSFATRASLQVARRRRTWYTRPDNNINNAPVSNALLTRTHLCTNVCLRSEPFQIMIRLRNPRLSHPPVHPDIRITPPPPSRKIGMGMSLTSTPLSPADDCESPVQTKDLGSR